jgi:hypothetical protein
MARLPGMRHVINQAGGIVTLTEDYTELELVQFDPSYGPSVEQALRVIRILGNAGELSAEDACFALVWSGYFHAHAPRVPEVPRETFITEDEDTGIVTVTAAGVEVVRFPARDMDACGRAQKVIHDSGLSQPDKDRAHFWSGFFYGLACQEPGTWS